MKVLCVIDVDEDMLKNVSEEDIRDREYDFNSAFSAEMRWVGQSGIRLTGFTCITDEDAEAILTRYII